MTAGEEREAAPREGTRARIGRLASGGARSEDAALLRAISESLAVGLFLADATGHNRYSNLAFERMTGRSEDRLFGFGWLQAIHPGDRRHVFETWRDCAARGQGFQLQTRLQRPDGWTCVARVQATPAFEGGRLVGYTGTVEDITERLTFERLIAESEARFRNLFESIGDAIVVTDTHLGIRIANRAAEELFGFPRAELLSQPLAMLYAGTPVYSSETGVEVLMRRSDGWEFPCEVRVCPFNGDGGELVGFIGTMHDISERKRTREERDRIFDLSLDLLAVMDVAGRIVRANPAWSATLGLSPERIIGTNVFDLVHPEDRERATNEARAVLSGNRVQDLRARFRCSNGEFRWVSWNLAPPLGEDLVYGVGRDVTELVEAQEHLEQMLAVLQTNSRRLSEQAAEMDRLRIEAEHLANHDTLTGLVNRRAWFAHATERRPTAIAIFDIDHFKRVNDTYGHPAGDSVLCSVAERLRLALPADALLGRLGGEEFGVLFHGSFTQSRSAARAAVEAVSASPIAVARALLVTVSVSGGLSPWRADGNSREQSLATTYEAADKALYDAKAAGRDRLVVLPLREAA